MATVVNSDLALLYYGKEAKIKEIAERFECTEENIRYHLFKKEPIFKKRDREIEQSDLLDLAQSFIDLSVGEDFERDLEILGF